MADFSGIIDNLMGILQKRYMEAPKREEARKAATHERKLDTMQRTHENRTDEMQRAADLKEEAADNAELRGWRYGTKDLPGQAHERDMTKLRLQESGLLERAAATAGIQQQGTTLRAREKMMIEDPHRFNAAGEIIPNDPDPGAEMPPTAMTPDRKAGLQGLTAGGQRHAIDTNPVKMQSWLSRHEGTTDPAEKQRALGALSKEQRTVLRSVLGRRKERPLRGAPGIRRFDDNGTPGFTNM